VFCNTEADTVKARDALDTFQGFIRQTGKSLSHLSPDEAIELMIDFYSTVRAEDCDLDKNGDMLLFQWGIYNWGKGEFFEYNITRQFIFSARDKARKEDRNDKCIWQLSLTLKFQVFPELRLIQSGDKWCDTPGEIADFTRFINDCEATQHVSSRVIEAIELTFEDVE
jgi:hypothetical protein